MTSGAGRGGVGRGARGGGRGVRGREREGGGSSGDGLILPQSLSLYNPPQPET